MSISYSFDIMLEEQFDHKSLEMIARAGAARGFTYFCDDVSGALRPLNIKQVTDYMSMSDKHDEEYLYIHYQDTFLNLKVTSHATNINLHFFGFYSNVWKKEFFNLDLRYVDIARHLRLFMDIYRDFSIMQLIAEVDN